MGTTDGPMPSSESDLVTTALRGFLRAQDVDAELLTPGTPMPTVEMAAAAIGVRPEQILKSLLFTDRQGACVLVIASGTGKVDRARLASVTGLDRPRLADPETVRRVTG